MTSPSLTTSGVGSEPLAPGVEEHHAANAAAEAISRSDLALRPEGHAPDNALLDLQRRRSEPLAPGVEEHHAAAAAAAISRGDLALRPEGHAADIALLDLQRRGSEPLAPGVEEHHAAAAAAAYPAAIWPSGPKATLVTSPSLTSSGVGRSRSPRASKSTTPPPTLPPPYPAAIWPSGPKATL